MKLKMLKSVMVLILTFVIFESNARVNELYSCTQGFMGNTCNIYDRYAEGKAAFGGACNGSGDQCDYWIGAVERCTTGVFYRDYNACTTVWE